MGKELSEMSLEDLWELFPIVLVEPDGKWAEDYREMEMLLKKLFAGRPIRRISHIGSTAIKGIWAKNIVDVLVEVPESCGLEDLARILERNGFAVMSAGAARISLNKGYTPNGFADKVYHIHLRHAGDNGELYFRDYLNEHPDAAKEYESLKLRLWKRHEHDRDAYTDAKGGFVAKWTAEARKEYGGRYRGATVCRTEPGGVPFLRGKQGKAEGRRVMGRKGGGRSQERVERPGCGWESNG